MKKIKKFKVEPRFSAVGRALKGLSSDWENNSEIDALLRSEAEQVRRHYDTAALFDTFAQAQAPAVCGPLWGQKNASGASPVAVTLYATTLGPQVEGFLADLYNSDARRGEMWTALAEESAEQAEQFIHRLISEEAKLEACTLSNVSSAPSVEFTAALLETLGADKIQVRIGSDGRLFPRFAKAGYILWWPPAKKRKG